MLQYNIWQLRESVLLLHIFLNYFNLLISYDYLWWSQRIWNYNSIIQLIKNKHVFGYFWEVVHVTRLPLRTFGVLLHTFFQNLHDRYFHVSRNSTSKQRTMLRKSIFKAVSLFEKSKNSKIWFRLTNYRLAAKKLFFRI